MDIKLKANLKENLQKWLEKNVDELGSTSGIWQDNSANCLNAELMANSCEVVIDSMALQQELNERYSS